MLDKNKLAAKGTIVYDAFHVDGSLPLSEQLEHLTEDLLQVHFGGGKYILDVGWYPSLSPNGCFRVYLIRNENWECPILELTCVTMAELAGHLDTCVVTLDELGC